MGSTQELRTLPDKLLSFSSARVSPPSSTWEQQLICTVLNSHTHTHTFAGRRFLQEIVSAVFEEFFGE